MKVLPILREIDTSLSAWLLHAKPSTEEEKAQAERVLFLVNQLQRLRHELILDEIKLASLNLTREANELTRLSKQISQTTHGMATVQEVIGVASSTISVVAGIIGALGV